MDEAIRENPEREARRLSRFIGRLRLALWPAVIVVFGILLFIAFRALHNEISYADILVAIRETPASALWFAVAATACSYLTLTGYDASSLRFVGAKVPGHLIAATSFTAYALGNTVGLGVLTGGAVRYRMYSAAGVEPARIARAIAFNAVAFGFGLTVVGAAGLLWGADDAARVLHAPEWLLESVASTIIGLAVLFIAMCALKREVTLLNRWRLQLPTWHLALQQLAISAVDIIAAAAVLWFLLPVGSIGFASFTGFYALALALGVVSHVPGGLGVFEAVMLLAVGGQVPTESLAGALVLYRGIYFLLPLALAIVLLVFFELRSGVAAPFARAAGRLSPLFLSALTAIGGMLLLVSGVTPATPEAQEFLSLRVPLPVVEASHFLGSVAGLVLLFVARGLLNRLDAAWWAATGLAAALMLLALPKGIAVAELVVFGFLLLVLLLTRREFDRRASLFAQTFSTGWWLTVVSLLTASLWLLFFAYRDVDYAHELWWQFEFDGHAPRSLRAITGMVLLGLGVGAWQLFRPASGQLKSPGPEETAQAAAIVQSQGIAEASLALLGDKHFLFSGSGRSFVMFGKRRRSWVALFDPVGPPREWSELIWAFIEMAERHGGRAAFYQVRPQSLPLYLDAGLRAYKLGEYAYLNLAEFSLKGNRRANLRAGHNRGEREGLELEIIAPDATRTLMPELAAVSSSWLTLHQAREKGFSLGAFDPDYVCRNEIAIVRQGPRIVAFATLMHTGRREEVSIDLMRHVPDAPPGTMDFLFSKVILHYQTQGYQRFGLGMAPLAGMATHRLAPRWHRLGRLLFARGENFYNFRGLRAFKEKFDPEWEARYLVAPGGLMPLIMLADIAALIAEGLNGRGK